MATLIPVDDTPSFEMPFTHLDKWVHFTLFAIEGFLLKRAALFTRPWLLVVVGVLLGVITELGQYYVPGRNTDHWDLLADIVGVIFGVWLLNSFKKIK
jgi:VanZ family protein